MFLSKKAYTSIKCRVCSAIIICTYVCTLYSQCFIMCKVYFNGMSHKMVFP